MEGGEGRSAVSSLRCGPEAMAMSWLILLPCRGSCWGPWLWSSRGCVNDHGPCYHQRPYRHWRMWYRQRRDAPTQHLTTPSMPCPSPGQSGRASPGVLGTGAGRLNNSTLLLPRPRSRAFMSWPSPIPTSSRNR